MTHTQNWITHREKKVSSSSPHTYNKIFHIFLSATWVWELWNGTYRDRKIYNQKISPGIHLFQLFFIHITMRCYHNNRSERQKKLLHLSFILRCLQKLHDMWKAEGRERERQQKKDEECFINYWIFFPFKDFFFRWRFYWKILFTCVLWKWNFTANLLTILQKGPKIALNDVNNEMGKIQIARGY